MYLMILACGLYEAILRRDMSGSWYSVDQSIIEFKCVIFRYPIREAVIKYDGDVITANRTFP
jgi:hypothetical protein